MNKQLRKEIAEEVYGEPPQDEDEKVNWVFTIIFLGVVGLMILGMILVAFGVLDTNCWPEGATENQCRGYAGDFRE